MNGDAITSLHRTVEDNILSSILDLHSVKENWHTLTSLYETKSLYNKIFLQRKIYTLRMSESTSMTEQ